jgi:hypothetical protein
MLGTVAVPLRNGPDITSRFPHDMLSVPLLGVQE